MMDNGYDDDNGGQGPANPPESLLKFDEPIFVGLQPSNQNEGFKMPEAPKGELTNAQLDDMLNSMLPPREWTEESGTWMQYISKEPATRLDVITLQEHLDKCLVERQARETGICPVREDLYSQAFDELIRHVTLDSPERGLLLLRARDEVRMTVDAYKTLYGSSVTFGVKKQLQAELGMSEMANQIEALGEARRARERRCAELRARLDAAEKRAAERQQLEGQARRAEIDFLKYQGQHLDGFLKHVGGTK
uniref:Uncharacterized protein n=1 Tax=Heterosigma akashiwo TaxID=2829 RepID=A0A6V1KR45_HETAK|mmetsp:Transcript_4433/g.7993  ORF Transcript_4433/g.7993 Transcript_4433/m.7993 type:complete len:250 (+) Transcript_4433:92-841(+)